MSQDGIRPGRAHQGLTSSGRGRYPLPAMIRTSSRRLSEAVRGALSIPLAGAALVVAATLPTTALLPGQEPMSGPEKGMRMTPVKVYAASGPRRGEAFDAASTLAKGPGLLLFVHVLNRETAPILRAVDELAAEFAPLGLQTHTVLLSGDRTEAERRVVTTSNAMSLRHPMLVGLDGEEGPGNYALDRTSTLTLLLTKDGIVQATIAFTDTGAKDIPRVRAAVEAIAGKAPQTVAELQALLPEDPTALKRLVTELWLQRRHLEQVAERRQQGRMRSGQGRRMEGDRARPGSDGGRPDGGRAEPGAPQVGKAPDDPELAAQLRALIQRDAATADLDKAFAAIDRRIGNDAALARQMLDGYRLALSLAYGTETARARMRERVEQAERRAPAARTERPAVEKDI